MGVCEQSALLRRVGDGGWSRAGSRLVVTRPARLVALPNYLLLLLRVSRCGPPNALGPDAGQDETGLYTADGDRRCPKRTQPDVTDAVGRLPSASPCSKASWPAMDQVPQRNPTARAMLSWA